MPDSLDCERVAARSPDALAAADLAVVCQVLAFVGEVTRRSGVQEHRAVAQEIIRTGQHCLPLLALHLLRLALAEKMVGAAHVVLHHSLVGTFGHGVRMSDVIVGVVATDAVVVVDGVRLFSLSPATTVGVGTEPRYVPCLVARVAPCLGTLTREVAALATGATGRCCLTPLVAVACKVTCSVAIEAGKRSASATAAPTLVVGTSTSSAL